MNMGHSKGNIQRDLLQYTPVNTKREDLKSIYMKKLEKQVQIKLKNQHKENKDSSEDK